MWKILSWKEVHKHHVTNGGSLRKFFSQDLDHRHSTPIAKRKASLDSDSASGWLWHHQHDAGFRCMQITRLWDQEGFHLDFRTRSERPGSVPQRRLCVKLWTWSQRCSRDFRRPRNVDLLRKASRSMQSQQNREAMGSATVRSSIEMEAPKAFAVHNLSQIIRTWNYGTYTLLDFGIALFSFLSISLFVS